VFGGVLLFHPGWVVSSALAGLASGFGMGPGVSLPLWTAVTLFTFQSAPRGVGRCYWWWGVNACLAFVDVWLRVLCVSFRPVSASSLNPLLGV
jgi:hypothetical protein